jgi:hypothetical protein
MDPVLKSSESTSPDIGFVIRHLSAFFTVRDKGAAYLPAFLAVWITRAGKNEKIM